MRFAFYSVSSGAPLKISQQPSEPRKHIAKAQGISEEWNRKEYFQESKHDS